MNVELKKITKKYADNVVLNDFSAKIIEGRITALTSPSGTGKTTLLRLIAGLEKADEGKILFDGTGRRPKISYMFQEDRLFEDFTAYENITAVSGKKHAKSKAQLAEDFEAVGLDVFDERKVKEYSGGMKRRVALLRAITGEYDILLLDEPFTGMEDALKSKVIQYIKKKTEGRTVILVTHEKFDCFDSKIML